MGYYDPHPTHYLKAPLLIYGVPGTNVSAVAYKTSAMTGLPFVDLERRFEHTVGQSLIEHLINSGTEKTLSLFQDLITRLQKEQPFGIWASGNLVLLHRYSREKIADQCSKIMLTKNILTVYPDWVMEMSNYPQRHADVLYAQREHSYDIKDYRENLLKSFPKPTHSISMDTHNTLKCVNKILQWIQNQGEADISNII